MVEEKKIGPSTEELKNEAYHLARFCYAVQVALTSFPSLHFGSAEVQDLGTTLYIQWKRK